MRPPHPQRLLVLLAALLAGAPVVFAAAPASDSDKKKPPTADKWADKGIGKWFETLEDVTAEYRDRLAARDNLVGVVNADKPDARSIVQKLVELRSLYARRRIEAPDENILAQAEAVLKLLTTALGRVQKHRDAIWIDALKDLGRADGVRATARSDLVREIDSGRASAKAAADELIRLAKETQSTNVRMHVAIALSELRKRRDLVVANLALLAEWAKAQNVALRYRAVLAIANARTEGAVDLLVELSKDSDDSFVVSAVARGIGSMHDGAAAKSKVVMEKGIPVLTGPGFLEHKDPKRRIAGIEGLRLTSYKEEKIVGLLFKVALSDPAESVWRAAMSALREMAPQGVQNVPPGATREERDQKLRVWQNEWKYQKRKLGAGPG